VVPVVREHLTDLLAWAPYDATPDYDARPEPGRRTSADLRVPVLNPLA
jgi:lipoyl(octanoyl) transferase